MSINPIIRALGVPKSTVYYKPKTYPARKRTLRKQLTEEVKSSILEITEKKATYGTPRVRAILKRDHDMHVSKYMVHRFMKEEGLLITRNRTRGSNRLHTGRIAVDQPNTRWSSDITSIKCWNGEKLRFIYILDC
ncbi:MAG: putative transposase [Flavobacteriales bacterium]|jgi:putative transposase